MANPLTTWRGEPASGFDIQQALAAIRARPDLSGFGGPHIEGSGVDAMMYDSLPFSATGSYFNSGYAITPNEDGTYLVYRPAEGGNASKLNGTLADKYDASGNYLGKEELKGISDASTLKDLATFAALAAGAGYGSSLLAGGAGGAIGGPGISFANGAPVFGAVDTTLPFSGAMAGGAGGAIAGQGITYANGAPVFGAVDTTLPFSGTAAGGAAAGGAGALTGVPPPANPMLSGAGAGGAGAAASGLGGLGSIGSLLGPAATLAGGLLGAKGQEKTQSETKDLPGFLQGPVNDLTNRAQGLLSEQMPVAQQAGQQMMQQGGSMLSAPIAGNGFTSGAVKLEMPNTAENPYLSGLAEDIQRRTQDLLGKSFSQIRGNAVGVGGLGGSRQAISESEAMKGAADSLQGNLAGLYGNAWNADANRALGKYNTDVGFYGQQRNADLAQAGVGAGLIGQGLQTQFAPLGMANDLYRPYATQGTTTKADQQGGGIGGAFGGALGAAQWAQNMGLFGNTNQQQQQQKTPGWW